MTSAPPSPQRVYHVREVLGRGGFGTVYRADLVTDAGFTKQVALKVLHNDANARPDHLARLRDEARMLGLIRHRALVGADALVRLDHRWTVVMEYVPGVSLGALRSRMGAMPVPVVAAIGVEVADALHAAYTAQLEDGRPLALVHRDLKPSNLQLTERGEVKVLDFGVARAEFDQREAHTRQVVYGSPPYLSPERLEGIDTHAGDIFALGITLGELLSGRPAGPAAARPRAHDERIEALLTGLALPAALQGLLDAMLAYDAAARPDAEEVSAVLGSIAHTSPGSLRSFAAEAVPHERRLQGELPGELTGHRLTEETELSELQALAAAVPTTWNDQTAAPQLISKPGTTWDGDISTLPTVIPTDAFLSPDELPTPPVKPLPPEHPTGWRAVVAGVGTAIALMSVVAIATVAFVVLVVITVVISGLQLFDDILCDGSVGVMADHLATVDGAPKALARAEEVQRAAARACATNDLASLDASMLSNEARRAVEDGHLDATEAAHLEELLERSLRGR